MKNLADLWKTRVYDAGPQRFTCPCGSETFWVLSGGRLQCTDWKHCGQVFASGKVLEKMARARAPEGSIL